MTIWLWVAMFAAAVLFVYWRRVRNESASIHADARPLKRHGSFASAWRRHSIRTWEVNEPAMTCDEVIKTRNISMHRYVMGLYYWEQLNMATGNLFSLAHVASNLRARTVLPFTRNSRLYGLPNFNADYTWSHASNIGLDLIYDVPKLHRLICSYGIPPFASLRSFMVDAERDLIVVHFIHAKQARDMNLLSSSSAEEVRSLMKGKSIVECSDLPSVKQLSVNITNTVNNVALRYNVSPFRIVRYICVNASHTIQLSELITKAGLQDRFSLITVTWRGMSEASLVKNSAMGEHLSQRVHMAGVTIQHPLSPSIVQMPVSSAVQGNASLLLLDRTGTRAFIGIHFRSEKLGQRNNRLPGFFKKCIEQALNLRDNLILMEKNSMRAMVFVDYGKQGSNSCRNCRGAKFLKRDLRERRITPVHFDSQRHNAVSDAGFAAMVEMSALSKAKHLVLVGGGAFQKQTALEFKSQSMHGTDPVLQSQLQVNQKRRKRSVYRVCWEDLGRVKRLRLPQG